MIDAEVDVLSPLLLFLHKPCCEAAAASIHDRPALLLLDRGVEAQVLPACEAEGPEILNLAQLLGTILHQRLELGQGLFDLRCRPWWKPALADNPWLAQSSSAGEDQLEQYMILRSDG